MKTQKTEESRQDRTRRLVDFSSEGSVDKEEGDSDFEQYETPLESMIIDEYDGELPVSVEVIDCGMKGYDDGCVELEDEEPSTKRDSKDRED